MSKVLHPSASQVTEIEGDDEVQHDDAAHAREARALYQTLENWRNTAVHDRVQAGNCVYQHAAQV